MNLLCEQEPSLNNGFTSIQKQLPEKGKDIIAICADGETREIFRCACRNPKCREWRCSLVGSALMFIEVERWKYVKQ